MASRHQRRKKAAIKREAILSAKAQSFVADGVKAIVKRNLATPISESERLERRAWQGIGMTITAMKAASHRGYVCKAGGSMDRRRALALKAKGSY